MHLLRVEAVHNSNWLYTDNPKLKAICREGALKARAEIKKLTNKGKNKESTWINIIQN